ncbi:LOW QUALITY PROTEIN: uncharacterized protein [Panulirus ornatus]|uniref:LOW QUALITY PROTEIN: uncharacterized protein n=1 Tax=Panulirus ornatus TaxID=150431 RepID=UPI003A87848E
MPVSPTYGQSGYVNRSYVRSSSSTSIPLLEYVYGGSKYSSADIRGTANNREDNFASYFKSKYTIPEDGPASSYLAPKYTPTAQTGYQLKRYSSSDNLPETRSSGVDTMLKKSPSTSSFLTGGTTSFLKSRNTPESTGLNALYTASRPKNFDYNLPTAKEETIAVSEPVVRKYAGKSGGQSNYVNQYLARINKGKETRPREIDTRDINTTEKPKTAKWHKPDPNNEDEGLISRNRQVVRLTIKREKDEPQDPFVIKNKTLQTIAQRLMEKYRVPEKKPTPRVNEPTKRFQLDAADPPKEKPPAVATAARPPLPSSSTVSRTTASVVPQDPLTSQTSPKDSLEASGAVKSAPSSCEEEKNDDAATRLLRATTTAANKRELESWEEVQDAIYAAVLHPDVDIESDEEMEKLVKGDDGTSDGVNKDKDESAGTTVSTGEGKGKAIVGQLKRFVKQQESTKSPSKKRSSAKNSRKSKKSTKGQQEQTSAEPAVEKTLASENVSEKEKVSLLTPDLVINDTKSDKKNTQEKVIQSDEFGVSKLSYKGHKDITDPVSTQSREKRDGDLEKTTKFSNSTALSDSPTKTADISSLLSADLVLNSETPRNENTIKLKTSAAYQKEADSRISEVEKLTPKLATDEREERKSTSKDKKKNTSSLLTSDLLFNISTPESKTKTKLKSPVPTGKPELERRKSGPEDSKQKSVKGGKEQAKAKLSLKPEEKVESSLLSPDLVLTSVMSETTKSTQNLKEPENRKSELEGNSSKLPGNEKGLSSTKIPKLKKTKKQVAVEETFSEVSPASGSEVAPPPSESVLQTQSASQEVSKSQDLFHSDVTTDMKKKFSSRTGATEHTTQTSYHQQDSIPAVETRKSVSRKEDECPGHEESSVGDDKGRNTTGKPTSDVLFQFATSKESEAPHLDRTSEDEIVVKVGGTKDSKDTDKGLEETRSVSTVSKHDDEGKVNDEGKGEKSVEISKETEGEKISTKEIKPPIETHVTKVEGKKEVKASEKPSGIPTKITEAARPLEKKKATELEESQKEVEQKPKPEDVKDVPTATGKTEECGEKQEDMRKVNHEQTLKKIEVMKDTQTSSDAPAAKKAFKRPRQVAPPPEPQKTIGNELFNARNILKRPIKQTPAAPTNDKQEQAVTTAAPTKKVWKRPVAPLVPPNQGDQFLQARSALRKPAKPKEDDNIGKKDGKAELKPRDDDKIEKKEEKVSETKLKKLVKKPALSSQPDEGGEGEQETRGRPLRKQRPTRSRSVSSSSSSSDDDNTVRKKVEKPKRLMKPKPAGTEKTPSKSPSPLPAKPSEPEEQLPVEKEPTYSDRDQMASSTKETTGSIGQDPKLSACQSADSGYGSSPSTPQPTPTVADVKDEEVCTVCGTNCHKKCEKQMPNLCGVNQKLLAEALSSVKKGGSADGTTRTLASPTKASSSVSGSETETTEDETESTDTDSDFFGPPEIRAPIQTCLKFKKYTVDDFNFIKVLGKGSYGKVMLAQQNDSENYFAVKCLKKDVVLEDNDVECTLIERKVLSLGTKHPYLCHLFCTFQTPSHLFFVMEYLTGGDLMFHIQHVGRFDEFRACFYAAEITSGLKFLHSKGIIYRDLKLDNILLDYQGHIRIADFGMCKLQVYLDRYADTFCGTPDYMAPEVIKGLHYNQCVDWWSFGVLLYEMLTGKSPFKGCDEDHLFWLICNDEPFYPKFLSKEATQILKQLLDKDSTRRLGIPFSPYGEITVHPFFKYIDWHKIERKEVETPYKPRLRHILDVQYFDPLFTKRHAGITPLDESILTTMDQTAFRDFSYTNPNITD